MPQSLQMYKSGVTEQQVLQSSTRIIYNKQNFSSKKPTIARDI